MPLHTRKDFDFYVNDQKKSAQENGGINLGVWDNWGSSTSLVFPLFQTLMAASKPAAFLALFLCVLLPLMAKAQEEDDQWFWIMADSINSTVTCPGRCLAVNDTGAGDYNDKPVVFVACKDDSSTESTNANNKNQRWLRSKNSTTAIQFNATAATDDASAGILCLHPDPATSNKTLKLGSCTGKPNQKWIVANNSIATLAFDPPRYLAMRIPLSGFLNTSDGLLGWRQATILPSSKTPNSSFTATFSMVDGTQQQTLAPGQTLSNESPQSRNFIINGGFEQSSYDFPNATAALTLNPSDPFSLCNWEVMEDSATLGPNLAQPSGNRSLLLKDGIVKQSVATSSGAFYTLVLKVATAIPDSTDESNQCNGSDTLSVNPYPSSNVHQDVELHNRSWTTQHISFQALGNMVQLAFQGCATCGCYLSDLNLMQVLDPAPFPPPPPRPSLPLAPGFGASEPEDQNPPPSHPFGPDRFSDSNRLSNGAVVGIVVGSAALFFVIGAACFWVVFAHKKEARKEEEIGMGRPREWSIQTTTQAQSESGARGNSSTTVPTPRSAAPVSASSLQTATNSPPLSSSSNPNSDRGA